MSTSLRGRPVSSTFTSGSALARARVVSGLTQQQLADASGLTRHRISQLENKPNQRPRFGAAAEIALALDVTVADLWPTLAKAVRKGRLLDTVIPFDSAVRKPRSGRIHGLRVVFGEFDASGGTIVRHKHRPPLCCGCMFCRVVDLNDPETYRVIAEPTLIAAGGVNA